MFTANLFGFGITQNLYLWVIESSHRGVTEERRSTLMWVALNLLQQLLFRTCVCKFNSTVCVYVCVCVTDSTLCMCMYICKLDSTFCVYVHVTWIQLSLKIDGRNRYFTHTWKKISPHERSSVCYMNVSR